MTEKNLYKQDPDNYKVKKSELPLSQINGICMSPNQVRHVMHPYSVSFRENLFELNETLWGYTSRDISIGYLRGRTCKSSLSWYGTRLWHLWTARKILGICHCLNRTSQVTHRQSNSSQFCQQVAKCENINDSASNTIMVVSRKKKGLKWPSRSRLLQMQNNSLHPCSKSARTTTMWSSTSKLCFCNKLWSLFFCLDPLSQAEDRCVPIATNFSFCHLEDKAQKSSKMVRVNSNSNHGFLEEWKAITDLFLRTKMEWTTWFYWNKSPNNPSSIRWKQDTMLT